MSNEGTRGSDVDSYTTDDDSTGLGSLSIKVIILSWGITVDKSSSTGEMSLGITLSVWSYS